MVIINNVHYFRDFRVVLPVQVGLLALDGFSFHDILDLDARLCIRLIYTSRQGKMEEG
jgi:hypothetical protein